MNVKTFAILGFSVTALGLLKQVIEGFPIGARGFDTQILLFLPPALFAIVALLNKKLTQGIFLLGMLAMLIEACIIIFPGFLENYYTTAPFQWINLALTPIGICLVAIALVKRMRNKA